MTVVRKHVTSCVQLLRQRWSHAEAQSSQSIWRALSALLASCFRSLQALARVACPTNPPSLPSPHVLMGRGSRVMGRSVNRPRPIIDPSWIDEPRSTRRKGSRRGRYLKRSGPHFTFRFTFSMYPTGSSLPSPHVLMGRGGRGWPDKNFLTLCCHRLARFPRSPASTGLAKLSVSHLTPCVMRFWQVLLEPRLRIPHFRFCER